MEEGVAAGYDKLEDLLETMMTRSNSLINNPHFTSTDAQPTAMIHLEIPRSEIAQVMGPAIMEIYSSLGAQNVQPAGPFLSHHLKMQPDTFNFDICVPVSKTIEPVGRVVNGMIDASNVARTVYRGPYEKLGEAWGEFMEWIEAQGKKTADDLWEVYLSGPESSSDPIDWCTESNKPILA